MNRFRQKTIRPDQFRSKELAIEYKIVRVMIDLYCRKVHLNNADLCVECRELLTYAEKRIKRCPHYENKIPCKDCSIHCYGEPYKSKIREVMKFSGPRMTLYHPVLAIYHLLAKFKTDRLAKQG